MFSVMGGKHGYTCSQLRGEAWIHMFSVKGGSMDTHVLS